MTRSVCEQARAALDDAFLERRVAGAEVRAHLDACVDCREAARRLSALADELARLPVPDAPERLVSRTILRARAELASALAPRAGLVPGAAVPRGFVRELARLLAVALAALPIVLLWNAAVIRFGGQLLSTVLPEPVLAVVAGAYVASVAGWLAFLYGSIPFVAHRRVRRMTAEAS